MTSFAALEPGKETSRPLEVYVVNLGAETFRYTNHGVNVVVGSDTYDALPGLSRTSVGQGSEERKRDVTFRFPAENEFVQNYVSIVPGTKATVTVFRLQHDEVPTFNTKALQFKGTVANVRFVEDGEVAEVVCRSIEANAGKSVPLYTLQQLCNHVLYGEGCEVNPTPFRINGLVTSVLVNTLTVSGLNAKPNGWFTGGFVSNATGNDHRLIVAHTGNNIILNVPFAVSPLNSFVDVFAGCDHDYLGDCGPTKFNNRRRHGGWPFPPTKNPFATGLD